MKINATTIELHQGDITELETEAIVNAANSHLILGGGVAGAIRMKGGPSIQEECHRYGGAPVGTAVITGGGNLRAKYVIHAVGPMMGEGDEDAKLRSATCSSLMVADENHLKSIAFPAISTGIFGYPLERCANIMIATTLEYIKTQKTGLEKIVFCLYDDRAFRQFETTLQQYIQ